MNATPTRKVPLIAKDKDEFVSSLFSPGGTADGYVIKRRKWSVDIFLAGREYRVNRWLVLCEGKDGGLWTYAGEQPWSLLAMDEAWRGLAVGSEWIGKEIAYRFV